jgi:XTP/dITP diphosphohydrolase
VIASHNPGKLREIAALLAPHGLSVVSAGDLGLGEPEETGDSFEANARLKALAALDGRPGIHSARWAGPERDFGTAMARVEANLAGKSDRRAHFVCVLALAWPDGRCEAFEGRVDGRLVWPPRGDRGFGYDPMFLPDGHDLTFGQMDPALKHAISHRARAFEKFLAALPDARP